MSRWPAFVAVMAVVANQAAAQTSLSPGQSVQGELTASDPKLGDGSHYDCFTLQTRQGQILQIDQTSDAFDSYLQAGSGSCSGNLSDPVSDDDSGGGLNARLEIRGDGRLLTVKANSLSEGMTGRYTLTVSEVGQTSGGGRAASPAPAPAGDPFNSPSIFVARTDHSTVFGLPIEPGPNGLIHFPVLQMFTVDQYSGPRAAPDTLVSDAILFDYTLDCANGLVKRNHGTGYLRRAVVGETPLDEPFETSSQGQVNFEVLRVGCSAERPNWQAGYPDYASKIARLQQVN